MIYLGSENIFWPLDDPPGDIKKGFKKNGDFSLVLAVKKEKKNAPQALAGGRKGTGKG